MSVLDSSTQPAWNSVQSCPTPVMPYDTWTSGVAELTRATHTFSFCTTTDLQALAEHSIPASHSTQAAPWGSEPQGPAQTHHAAVPGQDTPFPLTSGSFWSSPERDTSWSCSDFSLHCPRRDVLEPTKLLHRWMDVVRSGAGYQITAALLGTTLALGEQETSDSCGGFTLLLASPCLPGSRPVSLQ